MSNFKTGDFKAIAWYARQHDLKVELASWPFAFFSDRKTKVESKVHFRVLQGQYTEAKKEDARQKRREARQR